MGCNDYPKTDDCFPPTEEELFNSLRHRNSFVEFRYSYSSPVLVRITKLERTGCNTFNFEGVTPQEEAVVGGVSFKTRLSLDDGAELKVFKEKKKTA